MKATVLHAENELPRVEIVSDPGPPGKGQILVRVAAAGLNYADTMMRRGFYLTKIKFPHVPGLEYSGTVDAVGEDVFGIRTGSRVMGLSPRAFAERIVVDARTALPVPERFSMEEAAGFPLVFLTAYPMLTLSARARAGETILVHAAAGGVGTATVQLAKHLGLKVIASASSDEKLERVRALGADFTINYSREDFVARVREITGGRGADVIFESIGGDFIPKNVQALAPFGRMIVFGMASGRREALDLGALFQNSVAVSGFWLVTLASQPRLFQEIVAELMGIIESTPIRPIIGAVYTFQQVGAAFQALESRASFGKLVLKPS